MAKVWVASEVKLVLLGTMPFNGGFCANSWWLVPAFYYSTLIAVRISPYLAKYVTKLRLSDPSGLSRWALNSITGILVRGRPREICHRQKKKRQWDHRGRE